MNSLREMLDRITENLGKLNASQKIAIGMCAIVIAGSLAWLFSWSAMPEMTPLLAQDMSYDELDAAEQALRTNNIKFSTQGQRIYVEPAQRQNAMRLLSQSGALPEDMTLGFEQVIKDSSPFQTQSDARFKQTVALQNELAGIIATSPNVEKAAVFIQSQAKRTFGLDNTKPSASIKVTPVRGQAVTMSNVQAWASLVAGSVKGLNPWNVNVTDGLRSYKVPGPEEALAADILEQKRKQEEDYVKKIQTQLAYIPNALVSVTVALDNSRRTSRETLYDKSRPKSEEKLKEESSSGRQPGEEGVNPNVGVGLTANASGSGQKHEEEKAEFYDPKVAKIEDTKEIAPSLKRVTASIGIPRSFLVSVFKSQPGNEDQEDPPEGNPVFEELKKAQLQQVRQLVRTIIMAEADEDVQVTQFYDFDSETGKLRGGPGTMAVAGYAEEGGTMDMIQGSWPEIMMGVMAVVAMGMMLMLVRKSSKAAQAIPIPQLPEDEEEEELVTGADGMLHVGGGTVGMADSPDGVLIGQEVDEDTLRFSQLGEQVSRLVNESPDIATDLLRRWLEQD